MFTTTSLFLSLPSDRVLLWDQEFSISLGIARSTRILGIDAGKGCPQLLNCLYQSFSRWGAWEIDIEITINDVAWQKRALNLCARTPKIVLIFIFRSFWHVYCLEQLDLYSTSAFLWNNGGLSAQNKRKTETFAGNESYVNIRKATWKLFSLKRSVECFKYL